MQKSTALHEVMLTAVARLGVDAAIIFADLLPILEPLGFQLEFAEGEGPVIHNPLRTVGRSGSDASAGRCRGARVRDGDRPPDTALGCRPTFP